MNIADVRAGLAANLHNNLTDIQVSAYVLANPTTPSIHILPAQTESPIVLNRGTEQRDFLVQAMTGLANDKGAQIVLDKMLSDDSVIQAILSDPSLGGVVDDITVVSDTGYQVFARDGQPPLLGAEWRVRVYG